jgi:ketosteroid isomerase-like protein
MAARVRRSVVKAFYQAFASRDPDKIAPFLAPDVDWMIVGPVDLLHFCGQRRGKAAVLDLFRRVVPEVIQVTGFEQELLLVDKDRAASYARISGIRREDGRTVSYRCSHFLRFEDDKVVEFRSVIDSFDAAEQMLGHPIDLSAESKPSVPDLKVVTLVPA